MSMTLILWKGPQVREAEEAERLLAPYYEHGDDSGFEPSESIAACAEELRQLYPDDPASMEQDDCPWAEPGDQTDRLLLLIIRWSASDEALLEIERLAKEHDLVLYDPQGPDVHLPDDPVERGPIAEPTALDRLKILAMVALFAGLTWAAWQIPIGWLSWIGVAVGTFFTIASLVVVYAMLEGPRDEVGR